MSLQEVAPEPVKAPPGVPLNPKRPSYIVQAIKVLSFVQKWSVVPFSVFAGLHLLSVVVTPAMLGIDAGNDLILAGRELYQNAEVEWGLLVSTGVHVVSGLVLNGLRKYYNYIKYGTSTPSRKDAIRKYSNDKNEVDDINDGLGGLGALLGLGPRSSLSYRVLGISPLGFSGYVFLMLLAGHVYMERVEPLMVHGESGFVDLGYVAKAIQNKGAIVPVSLFMLVVSGVYHMSAGWNRILSLFRRRDRLRSYGIIGAASILTIIALWRIK